MAGQTNISDYRFSIFINNDQAKRSLVEMEKVMIGYEQQMAQLIKEKKKDSQEYRDANKAYNDHLEAMKKVRQEAGLQAMSLKELRSLRQQLNNELARAIPGTEHRKKLEKEFGAVNTRITEMTAGAKTSGMTFGKMADGFNRYFAMVTAGLAAFSGLAFSIKELITAQGELDDSLANIRKSTGMTANEVQNLNKELGTIDTRTSRQDLREMAVVAGQLGMAKEDVFSFVESVDKLNVALGDEFTGGAEEVAKQMGMLRNVLTDSKTANVADDMMRVGNAINELGAAGFATGPVMSDFASRIGGIGIPLGLTSDEVLGMSATLQELNVNAERGGTAVVKIMQKMTTNTKAFAGVAGMDVKEFTNLVNTDLYGAFLKVIEGSNKGGQSATELAGIIKELEISGVGASEIFAKLGTNTDMLAEKVAMAGSALQSTDSITAEFNIKNATLGAVLAKLQKDFYSLITMQGVTEFFKNQVFHVVQLVNWIKDLPLIIEKYKVTLIAIAGVTAMWVAAKTRSLQVSLLNNLTLKEGILLKAKDAIVMEYLIIKEELLTIWKKNGTVATKLAATAQWLWNAALAANPIGLVIAGITALVAGIVLYTKYNSSAVALDKLKAGTTVLLANANTKLEQSYSEIQKQVNILNRLSAIEKKNLEEKLDLTIRSAEAELLLYQAKQKSIGKDASKTTVWQNFKLGFQSGDDYKTDKAYYEWENAKNAMEPYNDGLKTMQENINQLKSSKTQLIEITKAETIGDGILAKTQEALSDKLAKYQTALRNTTAGSEEYKRIQDKIKQTNVELAKFDDAGGGAKGKALTKLKNDYELLTDNLKQYQEQLQVEITRDPESAKIIAQKIQRIIDLKASMDDAIKSMQEMQSLESGPIKKMTPKNFNTNAGLYKKDKAPDKLNYEQNTDPGGDGPNWIELAQDVINYTNTVLSSLQTIDQAMSGSENSQLQKDAFVNDEKKKNLKRQLDAKLITQQQYDSKVAKLDQEMDNKKKELMVKQAKRQKALSIAQTIISIAQGVVSALATSGNPIIGIIMAALVGALGAVQLGYMLATPIPEAAKGRYKAFMKTSQAAMGRYDVLGQDDGKQYRGVPYMESPQSGIYSKPTLFAETGREIILNPKHTENLMKFRPDLVQAIMSVPQRAAGLYPDAGAQRQASQQQVVVKWDQETLDEFKLFREQLKKPIRSSILYDEMTESMNTVSMIEANVTR